jgi:hypothetical protein
MMAAMSALEREWARLGAMTRLQKLDEERASILKAFPELRRASSKLAASGTFNSYRTKRQFSAAARRRMSAGMRKYWARRRAAGKVQKA